MVLGELLSDGNTDLCSSIIGEMIARRKQVIKHLLFESR